MPYCLPDGTISHRVYLVPYMGPIPQHTTILTSLQQLQHFQPVARPTIIPSAQPQSSNAVQIFSPLQKATTSQTEVDSLGSLNSVDAEGATNETKSSGENSPEEIPSKKPS